MKLNCALLAVVLVAGLPLCAQEAEATDTPRTGVFETRFGERSPHSQPDAMARVTRWDIQELPAYDLADHTFQLAVPDGYDGDEPYGLLVFIHPNSEVSLDRFYARTIRGVLAEHKLIWVSYSGGGNPVMPNIRLGLALDAVHNVKQQYEVDTDRVYVSGLSGGGRMSCMAGIYYPGIFDGAVPIVGTLYFRDVKVPEDAELRALIRGDPLPDNAVWPANLIQPSAGALRDMKREQRWVLLAGEKDFNMPQMRAHFEQGFARDEFEHAHYLEVPGMAHRYPQAEWFSRAISLLDAPLRDQAALPAVPPADEQTQRRAQGRLDAAMRVLERDEARGIRLLQRLRQEFPNTEAAHEAGRALEHLLGAE
ncbi:MAG: PHB depolymerase family esterase [Planctomycetota bacterium]